MANLKVLDGDGNAKYLKETGIGTDLDPHVSSVDVATMPTVTVNAHAVTNAGTFATQVDGAALTALQLIDNMIAGSEAQVDVVAALPAGTNLIGKVSIDQVTANANEVVVKSGTVTAVTAITNALPAGANAIGKLAANSGVDIGDVDITSIAAGNNNIGDVDVASIAAGETHIGAIGGNATVVTVTPTLTVHATYVAGDYVGESAVAMTFASCARVNGGTGKITGAVMVDYALQSIAGELWLFDAAPTPPNDSAAWTISDAHALTCIGVIPFNVYYASALNSVSPVPNLSIPFKAAGGATSLYGCFVTRGAPAYASGDISFRLFIDQD